MFKQRAMNEVQKEQRRRMILEAALELFRETSFEAVSMAAVARKAGIAKGTVYLYFQTKEELFLALQEQAYTDWFDEVTAALRPEQERASIETIVTLVVDSLGRRPDFIRLIAILHTVLEHNVDFSTARHFKGVLRERARETGRLLEHHLAFLQPGEGALLLLRIQALVIGIQHLSDPAPVVARALEEPGMDLFRIDFQEQLTQTLTALLLGLEVQTPAHTHEHE